LITDVSDVNDGFDVFVASVILIMMMVVVVTVIIMMVHDSTRWYVMAHDGA